MGIESEALRPSFEQQAEHWGATGEELAPNPVNVEIADELPVEFTDSVLRGLAEDAELGPEEAGKYYTPPQAT